MRNLSNFLTQALDWAIVLVAAYWFLRFIRGTKAMRILWGLAGVGALYAAARFLGLQTTSYVLAQIWVPAITVIAIVFQPEIRSALAELSAVPRRFGRHNDESPIEAVVTAVEDLSAHRTGALIVLQREVGLRDYIATGIRLDARVSRDVLVSIFNAGSPLHDGATVLVGSRIAAARCILPLCEESYCQKYGTRHRAAAGIAQATDAVAVVVSEETGRVTVVQGTNFMANIPREELRRMLNELCWDRGLLYG